MCFDVYCNVKIVTYLNDVDTSDRCLTEDESELLTKINSDRFGIICKKCMMSSISTNDIIKCDGCS